MELRGKDTIERPSRAYQPVYAERYACQQSQAFASICALTVLLWFGSRLPDGQLALIDAVISTVRPSTKVIILLFNGGGLAIEKLMIDNHIHAIVSLPLNPSNLQGSLPYTRLLLE